MSLSFRRNGSVTSWVETDLLDIPGIKSKVTTDVDQPSDATFIDRLFQKYGISYVFADESAYPDKYARVKVQFNWDR